jgi:RNA polymerase sigma factor (sigma-70 family)
MILVGATSTQESISGEQEAASRLIERYSWQLTSPEELVKQAHDLMALDKTHTFSKALFGAYYVVMYRAFMGDQDAERQRRACDELGHALTRLVAKNYPKLASHDREDIVQETLLRVWKARTNCREPIAFLSFAGWHLLTTIQQAERQRERSGEPFPPGFYDDDSTSDIPDEAPPPLVQVLNNEGWKELEAFFQDLRRNRPRASKQIDVLELEYLQDLDDGEIARRLNISRNNVYAKRHLILDTIRSDPELLQRAKQLKLYGLE